MMDPPVLPLLHRRQSASPSGSPSRNPSLWSVIWSLILGFWGILVHWLWTTVTYCWHWFWGVVTFCWGRFWGGVTFCWGGFWKGVGVVWKGVTGGLVYVWLRSIWLATEGVFRLDAQKEYLCGFVASSFAGFATMEGMHGVCVFVIPRHILDTYPWMCVLIGVALGFCVTGLLVVRGRVYLRERLLVLEDIIEARVHLYAQRWRHSERVLGGLFYGLLSGMLMGCSYWVTNVLLECNLCDPDLEGCRRDLESLVSYVCLALAWMSSSVGDRADVINRERYRVSGCLTFIPIGMVLQSQWISWPHFLMGFPTTSVSEVMIMPMWNFLLECAMKSRHRHALLR